MLVPSFHSQCWPADVGDQCARINDMTGTILLCRGAEVSVWTLNGDLLLKQDIFAEGEDQVHSCSFYEGTGNEYLERDLIFTGQKRGVVNVRVENFNSLLLPLLTNLRYGMSPFGMVLTFWNILKACIIWTRQDTISELPSRLSYPWRTPFSQEMMMVELYVQRNAPLLLGPVTDAL